MISAILATAVKAADVVSFVEGARALNNNGGAISSCVGDLDNDGTAEFVTTASSDSIDGHFRILKYDGATGGFSAFNVLNPAEVGGPSKTRPNRFGGDLAVGDINGDGFLDIVVPQSSNGNGTGQVSWFENPGGQLGATWAEHVISRWWNTGPSDAVEHMSEVETGDVNGDGREDVVVRDVSHGIFVILQDPAGNGWQARRFVPCNPREGLALADLDVDGDLDLVINGVWFETPADVAAGAFTMHTYGALWYPADNGIEAISDYACQVELSDFNGDGRPDIAISNSEELYNAASTEIKPKGIRVFLSPVNPKAGVWEEVVLETAHFSWHSLELADFDGDGDQDLVSGISAVGVDSAPRQVVMHLNNGGGRSFTRQVINSGTQCYNASAGDADGDGDVDLLVPENWNSGPVRYYANVLDIVLAPPDGDPAELSATPVSKSAINLQWQDLSGNEQGYTVERRTALGTFGVIAQLPANATSYGDTSLAAATKYFYRVQGYNTLGVSAYSAVAAATTLDDDTTAPGVPTDLSVVAPTGRIARLNWREPADYTGGAGYRVYRNGQFAGNSTAAKFSAGDLEFDSNYTFTVSSVDAEGNESSPCGPVSVQTPAGNDPGDFLLAYWKLDEGSGTLAAETLGIYNASLGGAPSWSPNSGQYGGALALGGSDDRVQVPALDVPQGSSELTLAAWIRPDSFAGTGNESRFISKANGLSESQHYWMLGNYGDGSALRFRLKTEDGITTTLSSAANVLKTGEWQHVAATYDGSRMRVFRNGIEMASIGKTGAVARDAGIAVGLGNQPLGMGSRPLVGDLDEVRIYEKALSAAEIGGLMDPDAAVSLPDGSPYALAATSVTSSQIALQWMDGASNGDGFQLERRADAGSYVVLSQLPSGTSNYVDTSALPDTIYTYRVSAFNSAGNSGYSNEITARLGTYPGYLDWLAANGLSGAESMDSDGGGTDNFTEFLLDLNPRTGSDDLRIRIGETSSPQELEIQLPVLKPVGNWYLETSANLSGWADSGDSSHRFLKDDLLQMTESQRGNLSFMVPVDSGARYFRLRFESAP